MNTGSTPFGAFTTGEIRIGIAMKLHFVQTIAHPPSLSAVERRTNIVHEPVKALVALGCPFRSVASQLARGSEKIKSSHPRTVENSHEHGCGDRPKPASILFCFFVSSFFDLLLCHLVLVDLSSKLQGLLRWHGVAAPFTGMGTLRTMGMWRPRGRFSMVLL